MKKAIKILSLVLDLALICGALVIGVFAKTANDLPAAEGVYIITGADLQSATLRTVDADDYSNPEEKKNETTTLQSGTGKKLTVDIINRFGQIQVLQSEYDGNKYVAWSVYFKETDGAAVQAGIVEPTQLLKVNISHLYLKTRADKKRKNIIQGALNSFYGCIDVLSQGIARLEQGLTQDACARILNNLQKQFGYLRKTYQEQYSDFSEVCATMQTMLSETLGKTIYCKDLRYILCSACDAYIRLSGAFSL